MDIASHYPRPPMATRTTSEEKISLAASNTIYTYHCLCTNLLLATSTPLPALPTRQNSLDHAHIMPLPPPSPSVPARRGSNHVPIDHYGLLLSTLDPSPQIITSDDGFEKRYLHRCGRCHLTVGYHLDWQQFDSAEPNARTGKRDDVVYLLPGGFVTTSEMIMGKTASPASNSAVGGGVDIAMGSVTTLKA